MTEQHLSKDIWTESGGWNRMQILLLCYIINNVEEEEEAESSRRQD